MSDPDESLKLMALQAVERVLGSGVLGGRSRLGPLLRAIVAEELEGRGNRLKAYTIGVDVFGRPDDFDPNADGIVRVEFNRLRKALDQYLMTDGASDLLRIYIPKGSYRPMFLRHPPQSEVPARKMQQGDDFSPEPRETGPVPLSGSILTLAEEPPAPGSAISVGVLPFASPKGDDRHIAIADGLVDEIAAGLARNELLSIASRSSSFQYREPADLRHVGQALGVSFLVDGSVRLQNQHLRVNVELIDPGTGVSIWTKRYLDMLTDTFSVQETLASKIVTDLRRQLFKAVKRAIQLKPPGARTAWELFVMSTWIPGESALSFAQEIENLRLARRSLELAPRSGKAHSVLADKLAYLAKLDPTSDTDENREEAAFHARRALQLEPTNADVTFNVAMHYWHAGRTARSMSAARRTLELDPSHFLAQFLSQAIPYSNGLAPPDVIDRLVAFDAGLAPSDLARWLTLSWINLLYLNNGNYRSAVKYGWQAHEIFRAKSPETTYWLGAALVQLGDNENAVELIEEVLDHWPTIDPHHYADIVVPRRYGNSVNRESMSRVFRQFAEAVAAAINPSEAPTPPHAVGQ